MSDTNAYTETDPILLASMEADNRNPAETGRYFIEEAAQEIAKATGERESDLTKALVEAVEAGILVVYRYGSNIPFKPNPIRVFHDEAFWNDLNEWLEASLPRVDWRFPEPDVVYEDNAETQSDARPGSEVGNTASALPPRNITGIAKLFPMIRDGIGEKNLDEWKKLAREASRNGLDEARNSKGGSGQSIFDPWKVADWLVRKSYMTRAKVDRQIKANLEPGYEDFRDYLDE
jgi:hypothetical protein